MATHRRIQLTEDEMAALEDGQGWYEPGQLVWLGGYIEDDGTGTLDLCIQGDTHDNWTTVAELPETIRERLLKSDD